MKLYKHNLSVAFARGSPAHRGTKRLICVCHRLAYKMLTNTVFMTSERPGGIENNVVSTSSTIELPGFKNVSRSNTLGG